MGQGSPKAHRNVLDGLGGYLGIQFTALRNEIEGKRKRISLVGKPFVGRVKGEYENMILRSRLANCVFQGRDRKPSIIRSKTKIKKKKIPPDVRDINDDHRDYAVILFAATAVSMVILRIL